MTCWAALTTPAAVAVRLTLIVKFVLAVIAVIVAPTGMPVPVTVMPTDKPVVLVVVMTFCPVAPPLAVTLALPVTVPLCPMK